MSDGNIFYSQIDLNLQAELNARGIAGIRDRTERSMNYMLEKVANVEIVAMVDQKHIDLTSKDLEKNVLHRLGGKSVRSGAYLPTGQDGFLTKRLTLVTDSLGIPNMNIDTSYRIPPFITSAEMQLNDHSMGLLNSATVNIIIPNPDRDMDFMESVYARPGRAITMLIEHPNSAVITDTLLKNSTIQPKIKDVSQAQKMNRVSFNGLIKSFTYGYQIDGTVVMTIYLIGTSNVYTDVSMYVYKADTARPVGPSPPPTSNVPSMASPAAIIESEKPITLYRIIYDTIDELYKKVIKPALPIVKSYLIVNQSFNETISAKYESNDSNWAIMYDWNGKEQRYITLALLIKFINKHIISKQKSVAPNALIICSDTLCHSNYLSTLVSSNPIDIWIPGNTHDTYGTLEAKRAQLTTDGTNIEVKQWYSDKQSSSVDPLEFSDLNKKISFASRMYINLNVIDRILNELIKTPDEFKATNFLIEISKIISAATGNFINMKLISYPDDPDYLIYYDANFKGVDTHNVTPYSVPMFANHPHGSIVREFKFESKLPQNMQSLMYTVNQSDTISEEKIAPFLNYMYNNRIITRSKLGTIATETVSNGIDPLVKLKLDTTYKETYNKYLTAFRSATLKFAKDGLTNPTTRTELSNALIKHVQWPTSTINDSSQMTAAVYPMETSFTIDGINGLRYGDTVEFNALPAKYKTNSTFSIIGITHTVSTAGEWTSNISCIMRPKFD